MPFLNQRKGENDRRKYFMINLHERMLPISTGVEPATSWSPVGRRIQLSNDLGYCIRLFTLEVLSQVKQMAIHYQNMPIQIYWKVNHRKIENFQTKNSNIFHISAQNIDCGYSLEPPRRGGSNEYPQSMFLSRN